MKSKLSCICLLVLFALAAPAAVINFDELSGQAALPSNYGGLTWNAGWWYYSFSQSPYNAHSPAERVYNNNNALPGFSFAGPVIFQGAYFAGQNGAQYELYSGGLLVATSASMNLSSTPTFLSSHYVGLIDEVRLSGVTPGRFVMDDVTFLTAAEQVPEPATAGLLALGLAGLLYFRRR